MKRIEIIQNNYKEILKLAKISTSKTDLVKRLGWGRNMTQINRVVALLELNNFKLSDFCQPTGEKEQDLYIRKNLKSYIKQSHSLAGVLRIFEEKKQKISIKILKKYIKLLKVDISHFHTKNKYKKIDYSKEPTNNDIFIKNSPYSREAAKIRILRDNLIPYECHGMGCCVKDTWLGQPIILQLEHINGNNRDHSLENLEFLCPTCHSITPTHSGKNIKIKQEKSISPAFVRKLQIDKNRLIEEILPLCNTGNEVLEKYKLPTTSTNYEGLKFLLEENKSNKKVVDFLSRSKVKEVLYPPIAELISEIKKIGFVKMGKKLNCTDNAIRGHLERNGIVIEKEFPKNAREAFLKNLDLDSFLNEILPKAKSLKEVIRSYGLPEHSENDKIIKNLLDKYCNNKNVIDFIKRSAPKRITYPVLKELISKIKKNGWTKTANELGANRASLRAHLEKRGIDIKALEKKSQS